MTPLQHLARLADMAQVVAHVVPSPCISVCRMHAETGLCQGCFRTIDEIIVWGRQNDDERRHVWQHIRRRAGLLPATVAQKDPGP